MRLHKYRFKYKKSGFTLVELLVVIAVIGILVALILPAVQYAREAARRTQCNNNLKNIGVGLHNFHDTNGRFPAGWVADVPDGEPGWGWGAYLLPFIEKDSIESQIDLNAHIDEPENATARVASVPVYRCPSDPNGEQTMMLTGLHTSLFPVGRSNYVGVFGAKEIEDDPSNGDGVFYHNSRTRMADILDGTTNTIIVGERSSKLGSSTWVGMVHGATDAMARVVGSCDHVPNDDHAHFDDFSSFHATGAHFAFGDASVRIISSEIDLGVYQALGTRGAGEPARAF